MSGGTGDPKQLGFGFRAETKPTPKPKTPRTDKPPPQDVHHQTELVYGGWIHDKKPGKSHASRKLLVLPNDFHPVAGVPKNRSECPTRRPCQYVRCEWNLWMFDGEDRPGRRWNSNPPPSQVIAHTTYKNCMADVADKVERGELEIGDLPQHTGYTDKELRRIASKALAKLRANPAAWAAFQEACKR